MLITVLSAGLVVRGAVPRPYEQIGAQHDRHRQYHRDASITLSVRWCRHAQRDPRRGRHRRCRHRHRHSQLLNDSRWLPGAADLGAQPRRPNPDRHQGTGSYDAGLTRHLAKNDVTVLEVDRPDRSDRRRKGKDDDLDAISAAQAALHERRTTIPKSKDGAIEALRILRLARAQAVRERRKALQLLRMSIVAAPDEVRDQVRNLTRMQLIRHLAAWRPDVSNATDPVVAYRIPLKSFGRRYLELTDEIADLELLINPIVEALAPRLLERTGIGIEVAGQLLVTAGDNPDRLRSEASFAMLCGVSPLPTSSGMTQRHRLNRGGDRQANRALHLAVISRLRIDERTKAYVAKKTAEGH